MSARCAVVLAVAGLLWCPAFVLAQAPSPTTPTSPPGPTPRSTQDIFQASGTGNLARVRELVEADPSLVNALGGPLDQTPLAVAARNGQRRVMEYLVERGADVNRSGRHSGTLLDGAYENGQQELVEWLQARGARFTPLTFDVTPLSPAVRRVAFPWGMMNNILVYSGADGAVVVDTGFSKRAVDELRRLIGGWSPAGIRWVINTHAHGDHVNGNALAPSSLSLINAAVLTGGAAGLPITRDPAPLTGRSGRTLPAPYTLRAGGVDITLIHRPGLHSDSDVIVYIPSERVVDMGDLLLSESIPALDDVGGYLEFLEDALDVFPEDVTFVCGHGREVSAAGVRGYRDSLRAMVEIVRSGLAAGRTPEQMVKDDVLRSYKPQFSLLTFLPVDAFIPRVAAGLQKGTIK